MQPCLTPAVVLSCSPVLPFILIYVYNVYIHRVVIRPCCQTSAGSSQFFFCPRALDRRKNLLIIRGNFWKFCIKTCCDPSSEPSQHMVSMIKKKNYHQITPVV